VETSSAVGRIYRAFSDLNSSNRESRANERIGIGRHLLHLIWCSSLRGDEGCVLKLWGFIEVQRHPAGMTGGRWESSPL